jgi:hypothetical protein
MASKNSLGIKHGICIICGTNRSEIELYTTHEFKGMCVYCVQPVFGNIPNHIPHEQIIKYAKRVLIKKKEINNGKTL